jgi:hypothetical protein
MHTNPDLLALLALGEDVGAEEDLVHIAECPGCRAELAALTAAAGTARRTTERILPGQREQASVQLNALPGWSGSQGRATIEEDRDGNRLLVVQAKSPEPSTGPREVWLTNSQADPMFAMGFLQADGSGRFPIPPSMDLKEFRLVDVSQEPEHDHDPGHSGKSILRGKLPV